MGKKKKVKKKYNTKPIDRKNKFFLSLKRIVIKLLLLVIPGVATFEIFKWSYPFYTIIESKYITNGFGQINGSTEVYPVISNGNRQTCITLRNDNNRSIHIKKIIVHVYGYEDIKEYEDKSEKNGIGDLVDPIFLKAEIGSEKGEYFAETDQNYSEVEFIALEEGEIDIFLLSLIADREGLYDIDVEFYYTYGNKERCVKTDRQKLICVKDRKNMLFEE